MKEITRIRRMVVTIAIRLKNMGSTLSAAFKKAWALIKTTRSRNGGTIQ